MLTIVEDDRVGAEGEGGGERVNILSGMRQNESRRQLD